MNAEQKYFLKYGEALGILKERKSLMRFTEGFKECGDYHGEPRIMYGVEDAIRDAWQKRAACRNITNKTPKKHCQNCTHLWLRLRSNSCTRCKRNPDNKAFNNLPDYWMKGDFE